MSGGSGPKWSEAKLGEGGGRGWSVDRDWRRAAELGVQRLRARAERGVGGGVRRGNRWNRDESRGGPDSALQAKNGFGRNHVGRKRVENLVVWHRKRINSNERNAEAVPNGAIVI